MSLGQVFHEITTGNGAGERGTGVDNNKRQRNNDDDNNHEDMSSICMIVGSEVEESETVACQEGSAESVHFHDGVGDGKSICADRDALSFLSMSSFSVDREELGGSMNKATTTDDNDNGNDNDDNNGNLDNSTTSHVQRHGLEDLDAHAAKSSLHGFPDEPLKLMTEFGVRSSRAQLLVDLSVKAPAPPGSCRGAEPGCVIYRAPLLNVAPVGCNRAQCLMDLGNGF